MKTNKSLDRINLIHCYQNFALNRNEESFNRKELRAACSCEIVGLVASEHLYNMTNIGLNIHSDMLCQISRKEK